MLVQVGGAWVPRQLHSIEVRGPGVQDFLYPLGIGSEEPLASDVFDVEQSAGDEGSQMPARGRPTAVESICDLAGVALAAIVDRQQDLTSSGMRQRREDSICEFDFFNAFGFRH
jgi:hypothetical protein